MGAYRCRNLARYLQDCHRYWCYSRFIQCHAPMVIEEYSQEQWNKILPDMSIRAKLSAEDATLVQAYVSWDLNN